jgi:very-short-patch-repair endonuclease
MSRAAPLPADVLAHLGATASSADLVAICGRPALRRAVLAGDIVRVTRGWYALPGLPDPRLTAERLRGVVSHASAARLWGLDLLSRETAPHVTVPAHRNRRRSAAVLHWVDLPADQVVDGVTSPLRTVLDCARTMPFAEAVVIADSALRARLVRAGELVTAAARLSGAGRRRAIRVAQSADARSGSALESALRAGLVQARIRCFVPQLAIGDDRFSARVDLGDPRHRIALEADSFEHHGSRPALVRDCHRYDELAVRGWLVLRFSWEHVMLDQPWVIDTVLAALRLRSPQAGRTGRSLLWPGPQETRLGFDQSDGSRAR